MDHKNITIGFPRMHKEAGEKRVFLPEFIQFLSNMGASIIVEEGYGSRSGYTIDDFQQGNPRVHIGTKEEVYKQDIVIVLRSPTFEEYELLNRGSVLFSMLHFPTRPKRVKTLNDLGIKAISMDSVVDDNNIRLVENMKAVAWNGLEAAFDVLEKRWETLIRPDRKPLQVLILGTGMVGKHAVDAGTKLGNIERNNDHISMGGPGAIAITVGRNISAQADTMQSLMQNADILVDATQRRKTNQPVIPNSWISWLPEHSVVVDLAVDPYTLTVNPPVVRGVEGIPQGNLDQYIFYPDDPAWNKTVPDSIDSTHRRTTVSCYSWPGIHPEACMRHYAHQMHPLMEILLEKGYDRLSLHGSYFERAVYRATIDGWLNLIQ
jgi:alanine dehydrogenase